MSNNSYGADCIPVKGGAGGDGAVDLDFGEMRLDLGGFDAPGAVDELFNEAAFGEGAEVLDGGSLASEAEVLGDLAGGGRHAFARLVLAQIVEDGLLFFGEHVRMNVRSAERGGNQASGRDQSGNFCPRKGFGQRPRCGGELFS